MRQLYLFATISFWLLIALAWASSVWTPVAEEASTASPKRVILEEELAKHARPEDCWMAIHGSVYDLTAYLPEHPSRPGIVEPWCGKEATEAYDTKTKGRRHSANADKLLAQYRIGTFAQAKH